MAWGIRGQRYIMFQNSIIPASGVRVQEKTHQHSLTESRCFSCDGSLYQKTRLTAFIRALVQHTCLCIVVITQQPMLVMDWWLQRHVTIVVVLFITAKISLISYLKHFYYC